MLKSERFFDYGSAQRFLSKLRDRGIKCTCECIPYFEDIEDCILEVDSWVVSYEG